MAGLMYFVPGRAGQLSLAALAELGLAYAFDAAPFCREAQGDTPSGTPGVLVADTKRMGERAAKVIMAEQQWRPLPPAHGGARECYVGWYTDAPPTPADLARPRQLAAVDAVFADGQTWRVPIVRVCDDDGRPACRLPARYGLSPEGLLEPGDVVDAYRPLWDATAPYWDAMVAEVEVDDQECLAVAGEVLAANYYLHWREAVHLGLFSTELGPGGLVALAVGYLTWARWAAAKKKTLPPPSSTARGNASPVGVTD